MKTYVSTSNETFQIGDATFPLQLGQHYDLDETNEAVKTLVENGHLVDPDATNLSALLATGSATFTATQSGKFGIGDANYTLVAGQEVHISDDNALQILLDAGVVTAGQKPADGPTLDWSRAPAPGAPVEGPPVQLPVPSPPTAPSTPAQSEPGED